MEKTVSPPKPTEGTVLNIVTKTIEFPNGRIVHLSMSEWHWRMIEFIDLWNDHFQREHGILYEFYKQKSAMTDQHFSNVVMSLLRDDYNQWLDETPPGEEISLPDPRI